MTKKKKSKEAAAIELIGELSDAYKTMVCSSCQDPVEYAALAVRYMHAGMPLKGGQVMREAWEIDRRKSVPKPVIIEPVKSDSGYGGTNETTLPVQQSIGIPVACGAFPDRLHAGTHSDRHIPSSANPT